jgi:DDE domain
MGPPALRRVLPNTEHRRHKRLNNRAEHSHRPVGKRVRALQRFKSPEQARHFLETFSAVCNQFRVRRHRLTASSYRLIIRGAIRAVAGCGERRDESLTPGANDDDQRVASPDGYYASQLVDARLEPAVGVEHQSHTADRRWTLGN